VAEATTTSGMLACAVLDTTHDPPGLMLSVLSASLLVMQALLVRVFRGLKDKAERNGWVWATAFLAEAERIWARIDANDDFNLAFASAAVNPKSLKELRKDTWDHLLQHCSCNEFGTHRATNQSRLTSMMEHIIEHVGVVCGLCVCHRCEGTACTKMSPRNMEMLIWPSSFATMPVLKMCKLWVI
jgi:hypothetical protein